ncbi:2d590790-5598-4c06-8ad3-75fb68dc95c1 [Sclerotinia trifoliorum]|uniref:2d590790-5598-4c06-8ad3-75fb68dc95c1 n=1 Tax=Sclerotinia trifoliorum TaxID=28548 RepID=A0A8H2ZPY8_9HELO|nr:2d590790-5598-4c06-8ad3-75fb68dc95c1 [Sclerotinia trifoliorum]
MAGLKIVINPSDTHTGVDVVAVHGFNGNEKDTWESDGGRNHSALAERWFFYFQTPRICTYGYDIASDSSNFFVRQGLRDEAIRLLSALTKLRSDGSKGRNIVFVGHDVGGILVKEALIIASSSSNIFLDIYQKTRGLLFFSCPHQIDSGSVTSRNSFRRLFEQKKNASFTLTEEFIHAMACLVEDVNVQFLDTGLQYRVALANVSSVSKQPKESIFSVNETTLAVPNTTTRRSNVVSETSHIRIAQEPLPIPLDIRWDEMVEFAANNDFPMEKLMLSHTSIIDLQLCKPTSLTNLEDEIFQNDKYLNWMKRSGMALLTIQCLEDTERMSAAIARNLDRLGDRRSTLACKYTGNIHASNWISRLLFTSSIFLEDNEYVKEALSEFWIRIRHFSGPSPQDMVHLWREILLSYNGNIFWVLQDVDSDVGALRELFDWLGLLGASSEARLKVIIVTRSQVTIQVDALPSEIIMIKEGQNSSQLTENLHLQRAQCEPELHGPEITSLAKWGDPESSISGKENLILFDEDTEVLKLVLQRPQLYTCQSIIRQRLSQYQDPAVRKANLHWLCSLDSKLASSEIQRLVSNSFLLSPKENPKATFKRIMDSLKFKDMAVRVLELLLHSFRSLTPGELTDVIISGSVREELEATSWTDILGESGLFPVVLVISHDRVQFSRECFRQLASSHIYDAHIDHLDERTTAQAHSRIAIMCVEHIRSAHSSKLNEGRRVKRGQHLQRHTEFLSYAARYWPNHSELAGNSILPEIEPFKGLVEQHELLEYWVNAYGDNLEPQEVRPDNVSLVSPLSIFAEHGLEHMLRGIISYCRSMPDFPKKCLFALELAARNGHIQVIQKLLALNLDEYTTFDTAIFLSIGWQNTDAAIALIKDVYNAPGRLINSSRVLSRAILMGMSEVVALLISLMADNDQHYEGIDLFEMAGISGRVEIVKILIERRSELQLMDEQDRDMVTCFQQALQHGHHELLQYLINSKFRHLITPRKPQQSKNENEQDTKSRHGDENSKVFQDLMVRAARLGQFKILESLLMIAEGEVQDDRDFLVELIDISVSQRRQKCFELLNQALSKLNQADESEYKYGIDTFKLMKIAIRNGDTTMFQTMLSLRWPFRGLSPDVLFEIRIENMEENDDSLDFLKLLLEKGTEVFGPQILGDALENAIGLAISKGRETVAQWLIKSIIGLDLAPAFNSPKFLSRTPLFRAAYYGKLGLAKLILEQTKANPNATSGDPREWKALHAAYDSVEMTRLLIAFKADINQKDLDGKTPLFLAMEQGFFDTAKELLKHKPELNILVEGDTELSLALKLSADQDGDIFNTLLDAGADPFLHSKATVDHPLLHSCVRLSKLAALKALLLLNFSLEDDETKETALNSISSATEASVINLLVKRGASILTRNKEGFTPLAIAVKEGNIEVTKCLLSLGANIDDPTNNCDTPIRISCRYCNLDMVKLLLEKGANVNEATDSILGTPFQATLLRETKDPTIIKCLLEHEQFDPNGKSSWWGCNLNLGCLLADVEVIDKLLELKAAVEVEDHMGRSPIHFALYRTVEHIERISKACSKDVDLLAAKDRMGRNALHFAVVSGRLNVVQYVLKDHKDFVKEADIDGWTPLLWAIRDCGLWDTESDQKVAIIEELIKQGADLSVKGKGLYRDWTPRKLAKYYGLGDEMDKLLTSSAANSLDEGEHGIIKGQKVDSAYCDACLMIIVDLFFQCEVCPEFCLCFKCFRSKTEIHNYNHEFVENRWAEEDFDESDPAEVQDSLSESMTGSSSDDEDEILDNGDEAREGVVDGDENLEEQY